MKISRHVDSGEFRDTKKNREIKVIRTMSEHNMTRKLGDSHYVNN